MVFRGKAAVEDPEGQPNRREWSGGGEAGLEGDGAYLKSIGVKEVVARWPESSCNLGCPAFRKDEAAELLSHQLAAKRGGRLLGLAEELSTKWRKQV